MGRRRLSMLAVVALALVLSIPSGAFATPDPVTVTLALRAREEFLPTYDELLARFQQEHPGIKVERIIANTSQIPVLFAGGSPPDVWGEGGPVSDWAVAGMLLDLTPYVERDAAELNVDDFLPAAWRSALRSGKVVGIPMNLYTTAIAYNRTHLVEAGLAPPPADWEDPSWTYDQLLEYAKRLTRRTAEDKVVHYGFDIWRGTEYFLPWVQGFGGDYFDREAYHSGIVQRVTINGEGARTGFTEFVRMIYEHRVTLNPLVNEWHSAPSYWEPFGTGHISMRLASGWAFQGYLDAPGTVDWALAAVPQFPAGRQSIMFTDSWHIASTSQHPDAAWELVKFLTSPEAMEHFVVKTRTGPARFSVLPAYVEGLARSINMDVPDVINVIAGSQAEAQETVEHQLHGWNELASALWPPINAMLRNQRSVASALEEAQRNTQAIADEIRARLVQ